MRSEEPPEDDPAAGSQADADGAANRIPIEQPQPTRLWVRLSGFLDRVETTLRARGGGTLRFLIGAFWLLVAAAGVVLLVGPVINPPQTFEDVIHSADHATSRWIARDFDADYRVDRTSDGRMVAHVEERIDAFFPVAVHQRTIQRVLATDYQGHALVPTGIRATLDGRPIAVAQQATPTRLTLTIDAGKRLTGDHDVVLRYDLHDLAYESTDAATGTQVDLLHWDVLGPSWPQAFAALKVRLTLPKAVDDELVRTPRGSLAWLIVAGGEWVQPDATAPPGRVAYTIDSKQNVPPNAHAGFTMTFAHGTFAMPPHPAWFWVETLGPVAPLLLLAISLLLALAARAVAWSDDRGRPWFVAQYDPPKGITPSMAAQVAGAPAALELANALRLVPASSRGAARTDALRAVARAAQRAGRIGDRVRAITAYRFSKDHADVVRERLRRVPSGFVRDTFIGGSIGLSVLQLGLVRQLSHQARLDAVWWPVAFVAASWVLAAIVLAIASSARPLTRKGALVQQHLLGVGLFARQTSLLGRGPVTDPLLPYAVVALPARQAGADVVALIAGETGDPNPSRGWRVPGFLTAPRLVIRAVAPLVLIGVIVLVATVRSPTEHTPDPVTYSGDVQGTWLTKVTDVRAAATLTKGPGGVARLAVTEHLTATFDDSTDTVPQLAQQWPRTIDGQALGLAVHSVAVDGQSAAFVTERDQGTTVARTLLSDVLSGSHRVTISYSLGSAAVSGAGGRDRVRWAALLHGWDGSWTSGTGPVPLAVSITMPTALAAEARGGWIAVFDDRPVPFGSAEKDAFHKPGANERRTTAGGTTTDSLTLTRQDGFYPGYTASGDLGVDLAFPAGTFTGPSPSAAQVQRLVALVPFGLMVLVGALAVLIALLGIVVGLRRSARVFAPGLLRDLVRWAGPLLAISAAILAVWTTIGLAGDEPEFIPLVSLGGAAIVLTAASWLLTRLRRARR